MGNSVETGNAPGNLDSRRVGRLGDFLVSECNNCAALRGQGGRHHYMPIELLKVRRVAGFGARNKQRSAEMVEKVVATHALSPDVLSTLFAIFGVQCGIVKLVSVSSPGSAGCFLAVKLANLVALVDAGDFVVKAHLAQDSVVE